MDSYVLPWSIVGYSKFVSLFLAALLSKTVTATLPAALLVVVWWKRGRLALGDIARLAPMLVLAIPFTLHTSWLEKHHVGAMGSEWDFTPLDRILIAGRAFWFYVGKVLMPYSLNFIYARWRIDSGVWWQYFFPFLTLFLIVLLYSVRSKFGRGPLAAVLLYAGTLTPALGFFDYYPMKYSFVADHFQYLASIALIVLVVSGFYRLRENLIRSHFHGNFVAVSILLTLTVLTLFRCFAFHNVETLWLDVLQKNADCEMAHTNLGRHYLNQEQPQKAMYHFSQALSLNSDDPVPNNNFGQALAVTGKIDQAIVHFRKAVSLKPDYPTARSNLGAMLTDKGEFDEARQQLMEALRLSPLDASIHYNFGRLQLRTGNENQAQASFLRAKQLQEFP